MMADAFGIAPESRTTFWRTLQTFTVSRLAIAILMLAYFSVSLHKAMVPSDGLFYARTCVLYLALACAFWLLSTYARRRFLLQTILQISVDLAVISALYIHAGGIRSGLAILYLFPLAGGAILAPLLIALFFVSLAAFVILFESGYQWLEAGSDSAFFQAGLSGAALFAGVFVIHRLAARLIKQESLVIRQQRDLRVQQAINQIVIADMNDGILVVSSDGTLRTANPAAERMLGIAPGNGWSGKKLSELPSLAPIAEAFEHQTAQARLETASTLVMLKPTAPVGGDVAGVALARPDGAVHLRVRFASVDAGGLDTGRIVIFLQDVGEIENRAQELKLASMGRLTASIAHEVRNPLSAISYAASLLAEEDATPAQARLIHIVDDNVMRLNRMIEDILKLSRKVQSHGEPIALERTVTEIVSEFEETHSVRNGLIAVGAMHGLRVAFDPMHLREVLVNLLSNAMRYASGADGSIRLFAVARATGRLELHVQDDGPPISPQVRAHLFEPFYTTSSKGTGLGLYVARELCLNNEALLDYEYRVEHATGRSSARSDQISGRFVVTFAIAAAEESAPVAALTPTYSS